MRQRTRLLSPATAIAMLALFVALGGSVYAAKRARINGRTIRAKSLPGNRLKPRSVPANRLKPGVLKAAIAGQTGQITGAEVNELSLGQVPDAAHAESAEVAQSAVDAQTALNAVNAVTATTVNGHSAGCLPGTVPFAGACWQTSPSETALSAPEAATSCAVQGGTLPEALQLATFAHRPDINLDAGSEWSSDLTNMTTPAYAVVIVANDGAIDFISSAIAHKYRCVIPLVT